MAATVWKGQLTFALVSFPVRFFRAARAERIPLRRLARKPRTAAKPASGRRSSEPEPEPEVLLPTRNRVVAGNDAVPVERSEIVRGFEVEPGEWVALEEEAVRELEPETSRELEVLEFVKFSEIDPLYLETSYFVRPDEPGERPYALLFESLRQGGLAGIGQMAMHRREHVVILRPGRTGIVAHTMFYADEVRSSQEFRADTSGLVKRELQLAAKLIGTMVSPFDPSRFRDEYRARLQSLVESQQIVRKPSSSVAPDLLVLLERSLKKAG